MPLYRGYCGAKVAYRLLLFKTCEPAFMNNFINLAPANNQQQMKNLIFTAAWLSLFSFSACKHSQQSTAASGTGELETVLSLPATVRTGSPVMLTFTVKNNTGKALSFCKWHTPFEGAGGFMAAYLDITDANGENAQYRGVMAKRIMPPPAEAYIKVPAHDSVTTTVDILKGYAVTKPGQYKVVYQAGGMSGLNKVNEAAFTVTE